MPATDPENLRRNPFFGAPRTAFVEQKFAACVFARAFRPTEESMKRYILAGATVMGLVLSGQALAQSVRVEIAPEQRTRIKEYVVEEKVRPVTTIKERVHTGYRVPADVELEAVPSDWGPSVSKYRYFYQDNRVHFVDPASREVIYDID
jgi:hypothetical protein